VVDFHQDGTVLEVLEVRRILEPAATAMAAQRADEATVARLYALCDQTDLADTDDLARLDAEFHRLVAEASGNSYLARLLDILSGTGIRARSWRGIAEPELLRRALAEHRRIVDAVATRQPEVARAWSTVHVVAVEQWLRRVP
jgi:GntR family transcriptional repressor for pyruvate dehydrogenase complex